MPADHTLTIPFVVFALRRESIYFRRGCPLLTSVPAAPCRAELRHLILENDPLPRRKLLMLETGVGEAAMEKALRWCLSEPQVGGFRYRPSFLCLAGFSGALQSGQHVGDLVLATEVVDAVGKSWPTWTPPHSRELICPRGRILTVCELVDDPETKARLGQEHQALAVDMESALAARLCHEHQVPFVCLRAISDDCQTSLSAQLVEVLRDGQVSMRRLARAVLTRPVLIGELFRLAGNTRKAAKQLLALNQILGSTAFTERELDRFPSSLSRPPLAAGPAAK